MPQYIGNDIIGFVTSALHRNPLVLYREYLQNTADAYAAVGLLKGGKVDVSIDLPGSAITIRDYGPGLSYEQALRSLIPIARSQKRRTIDRGFRGVGRLSGLAFAESVVFETRDCDDDKITKVVWDANQLRSNASTAAHLDDLIEQSVTTSRLPGNGYPESFFEVKIRGVARHAAGKILNRQLVASYICEVCPLPLATSFKFSSSIDDIYPESNKPLTLHIILDGFDDPLTRPFSNTIRFSDNRIDSLTELQPVRIPALDGNTYAAIGWIAHSSYLGAIPKSIGLRGLRARVGNIQIGDESVFRHLFAEGRFNSWCIGELHIADSRIIPNGQRDYFEPGPHVRNLENQLAALLKRLVSRCRKASTTRYRQKKVQSTLTDFEDAYDLAMSGFMSADATDTLVENTLRSIMTLRTNFPEMQNGFSSDINRLNALEGKLNDFSYENVNFPFAHLEETDIDTYRRVCNSIANVSESPRIAKEIMQTVLKNICG